MRSLALFLTSLSLIVGSNAYALIPGATSCESTRSWLVRTCTKGSDTERCVQRYRRYKKDCIPLSICFQVYAPVCGVNPIQRTKTYSNECERIVDAARKIKEGPCKNFLK